MPLRRIGVLVAVVGLLLFALARISSVVVDWAWFSSIGYVDVFWTVFAAKAALFVVVFAVSTLLLWANGNVGAPVCLDRRRLRLPAASSIQSFATFQACPGRRPSCSDLRLAAAAWRLAHPGRFALVIGLLVALGETGKWELILRFIHQVPYGQTTRCSARTSASTCSRCRSMSR